MDKYPSLRREVTLTAHVTPWAKQFRDDIEALKEFDEGDVLVREIQGDLRRTRHWSSAEAWQTAHDVANAYLSMKHDVAKQAASGLALKEMDKELLDQHISPAVVTISDEEGEIDILARSGT